MRRRRAQREYTSAQLRSIGIGADEWFDSANPWSGPTPDEPPPEGTMWAPVGIATRLLAHVRLNGGVVVEQMARWDLMEQAARGGPLAVAVNQLRWGWERHRVRALMQHDRPSVPRGDGFVYVIGPAAGPVKVGFAKDPAKRLASLQTAHHEPLSVLATRPGTMRAEAETHRALRAFCVGGEWFEREPALAMFA